MSKKNKNNRSVWSHMIDGIRLFFWPRGGWRKAIRYGLIQMAQMPSSPYALAIGFSAGAFVSFTPFLGFHFLLAAAIAWVLRGNIIASALGTIVGNPLTFPFIWAMDYIVGIWILEGRLLRFEEVSLPSNLNDVANIFYPLFVGGLLSGLVCGAVVFILIYTSVRLYRHHQSKT